MPQIDDEFNQDPEQGSQRAPSRPGKEAHAGTKPKLSARSYMLGLLGQRDYSAAALRNKLQLKSYAEADIEAALQFAQEYGFQNDERYAGMKARNDASRMGDRNVQARLREKGIAPEVINEKVAELEPEIDRVLAAAARFEGKHLDRKLEQKAYRFLSARGFSSAAVKAAMAHLKATQPPAPEPEPGSEAEDKAAAPEACPEEELAREVERALKEARRFEGKTFDASLRNKVYRFLATRGYSSKAIKIAMARLEDGPGDEA